MKSFASVLLVSALSVRYVVAATLFIPFLDPQPITADIEGVDSSGHTTWRIGPGVPSGTLTDDSGLFGSATLVAGPTDVHFVENDSSLSFAITADCGVNGAVAVCTVDASAAGIASTTVVTTAVSAFDVQVAATAEASLTGTATSASATASATDSGDGESTSGGPGATGSGSPAPSAGTSGSGASVSVTQSESGAPSPTGGSNGAGRVGFSVLGIGMSVAVVALGIL